MGSDRNRFGRAVVVPVIAALLITSGSASSGARASDASPVEDKVDYDTLTLELALMLKTGADEAFLAGDLTAAHEGYCEAQKEIPRTLKLSAGKMQTVSLLRADVGYRLLLLEHGIGFWGGARSLRPRLPGEFINRMKSLLDEFATTGNEILLKVEKATDADNNAQQTDAINLGLAGRAKEELVKQSSLEAQRTFQEDKQDALGSRINELHTQRAALETEVASATDAAHQASAALEQTITDAVVQATGAPPELAEAIRTGDYKDAVLSAAGKELVGSDAFQSALADVDANVKQVAGYIKQGQDLVEQAREKADELKTYRNEIEAAANTLRNPTVASLAQLGAQIYPNLPEEAREQWKETVQKVKPVAAIVEMIDAVDDEKVAQRVRSAVTGYLMGVGGDVASGLQAQAIDYVGKNGGLKELAETEQRLATRAAALVKSAKDAGIVAETIARGWSGGFVERLPPDVRTAILKASNLNDDKELATLLRTRGLQAVGATIVVDKGALFLRFRVASQVAKVPLSVFIGIPASALPELASAEIKDVLSRTVKELHAGGAKLQEVVLKELPNEVLAAAVRTSAGFRGDAASAGVGNAKAWKAIAGGLDGGTRDAIMKRIVEVQVGAAYVEPVKSKEAGPAAVKAARKGGAGESGEDQKTKMQEELAEHALDVAFPGVGTGLGIAAKIYGSFTAFNESIERAQRAAAQLQANLSEELQVLDLRNEARLQQVVLGKEVEIAQIARDTALAQHAAYSAVIANFGNDAKKERRAAALRRSLYFYIAEQLRREYDGLDAALELWTPDGSIATRVRSDPQIVRLALDEDVHLYDWLDRERESTRADVDGLMLHWRQLYQLASAECADIGCGSSNQALLGSVGQTAAIPLTSLISQADRHRLEHWQYSRSSERFTLSLAFAPGVQIGSRSSPVIDPAWENVRVLNVRIGGGSKGAPTTKLDKVGLSHPGSGYVVRSGHTERTTLLRTPLVEEFQLPDAFTQAELTAYATGGAAGNFLGYPFYTVWQLTLLPDPENYTLSPDNLTMRFGVHYNAPGELATEQAFVRSRSDVDVKLGEKDIPRELQGSQIFSYGVRSIPAGGSSSGGKNLPPVPIDVSDPMVILLYHDKPAIAPCAGPPVAQATTKPTSPTAAAHLEVVRSCRPDAEIRRNLLDVYLKKRAPEQSASSFRRTAAKKVADLKGGTCKSDVVLPMTDAPL